MTQSNRAGTTQQARLEIAKIKQMLLFTNFEGIWLSNMIVVNGKDTGPVPKTVFEAYTALLQHEKEDPLKALAIFYAKFIVAVKPEFVHSSRKEKTQRFYQLLVNRKVTDIFPNNPEAITAFNTLLKLEVDKTTIGKSPEQKKFLEFQDKVNMEVNNIKTMSEQLNSFKMLIDYEKKTDTLQIDIPILMRVIDRIKMADIREDVDIYTLDALLILDTIMARVGHQNQIEEIKSSIRQFQEHHSELMTDLGDRKVILYFRLAMEVVSIAVGSHLAQHVSVQDLHATNLMEAGVSAGLQHVANKEVIGKPLDEPSMHHIYAVDKAKSWSDTYTDFLNTLSQPEQKDRRAVQSGVVLSAALFPALTIPLAVTTALYNTGALGLKFHTEQSQLAQAEKAATLTREEHGSEMKNYLDIRKDHKREVEPPPSMRKK